MEGLGGQGIPTEQLQAQAALRFGGGMMAYRASFGSALKRAAEEGILLFVKHVLVVALWAGTGFLLWREISIVKAQAANGQSGFQWLSANAKELTSLVEARKQIDAAVTKSQEPKK